jgi:hygromycin-B 4-O-kinase
VLDWEKATSNIAPQWELALALHDLGIDEKQAFTEGYDLNPRALSEMAPLIKTFNIINYVAEAERLTHIRDRKALDHLKARLGGLFDLYSL